MRTHFALLLVAFAGSCVAISDAKKPEAKKAVETGLDLTGIDKTVNPCDDFYRFSCGKWMDKTPIPPDRARWTRSFDEILDRNQYVLKDVLEKDLKADADPFAKKVHDYYATCMEESKLEGALPELRTALRRIDRISGKKSVAAEVARLLPYDECIPLMRAAMDRGRKSSVGKA